MVEPADRTKVDRWDELLHWAFVLLLVFFASITALALGASAMEVRLGRAEVGLLAGVALLTASAVASRARAARPSTKKGSGWPVSLLAVASLGALLVQWFRLLRLATERPIYDWDGLYYHVPALHGWVQAGRVVWLEELVDLPFANGYSMGMEVLSFLVHQAVGDPRWIDATSLVLWPLGVLALYTLGREAGAPRDWSLFAAGLAGQVPVFAAVSATTYVDAAFAVGCWATLAAVTRWMRRGERAVWVDAVAVGAAAGLMCGFKGVGWPFLLLLGAFVAVDLLRRPVVNARTGGQIALAVVMIAAVAGTWPGRNLLHTGNPLHPIELRIGEKTLVEGYPPHVIVDQDLPPELEEIPRLLRPLRSWAIFDSDRHGHTATGGLGVVWLALGLPALLALAFGWRGMGPRWWVLFLVLFLWSQPGAWWSRFTLWLHGLGLPASASALGRGSRAWTVPLAVLVLGAGAWQTHRAVAWEEQRGLEAGSHLSSFDFYFPRWSEGPFAEAIDEATHVARGRWGRMGTLMGGALSLPLAQRRIEVLPEMPTSTDLDEMAARGVQWLVWDVVENGPLPASVVAAAVESHRYRAGDLSDFQLLRLTD